MARNRFSEDEFNRRKVPEEALEFLFPDQRGEFGEDDPADHKDGTWTSHGVVRAARFSDEDHMTALLGPSRFRLIPLDRGDSTFYCRNRPVEITAWYNPAYPIGPEPTR